MPNLADIQGLAFYGYVDQPFARYLHVHFDGSDEDRGRGARAWLASVIGEVGHALHAKRERRPETLQIAFTADGLVALGLSRDQHVSRFPHEFSAGMNSPERARILGDSGENAPDRWVFGRPDGPDDAIHALLVLFADTEEKVLAARARHAEALTRHGARIVHEDEGRILPEMREHFGFRDGLSQPHVEGGPRSRKPTNDRDIPLGELLLGYENAYGDITPTVEIGQRDISHNGTFLVYRTMRQDVLAFWKTMYEHARPERGEDPDHAAERLAAKLVGRWRSGAPLVLHPHEDVASAGTENHFGFVKHDPDGHRCPLGAHIRRAHPRDMLPPSPDESLEASRRHRIVRRGRPYGPPLDWPVRGKADDGKDRGLVFIALNASIRRQFEFVQQTWINSPKFARLVDERDPMVGAPGAEEEGARFTLPGSPVRRCLSGLPSFTRVLGGAYFFLPGLRALQYLAEGEVGSSRSPCRR